MRKILSLIICLILCLNTAAVFADNDLVAKGLEGTQKTFAKYIEEALIEAGIDRSTIDEDKISISGLSDHYGMKKWPNPYDDFSKSELSVIIPLADGSDTLLGFFENGKFIEKRLRSEMMSIDAKLSCPIAIYTDEPAKFIEQNNIDDVEEILTVVIWEVLHMSAYYVKSGGEWYIIPYHFYPSYYNRANNEECDFEIGKAYTQEEFIRKTELEEEDTNRYLREQREKEEFNDTSDPIASKDENDNDIIKYPGSNKWVRLDEVDENDTKKDTKTDTDKTDKDKTDVKDNKNTDKTDVKTEDKKTDEKTDTKTDDKKEATPAVKLSNTQKADALKAQGLFKGTENGYELDRTLTRSESATMLIRLLGKEDKALTSSYTPVFDDVAKDDWYYGYVMCAYNNNIVMGTSSTEFTPDRDISAKEFTTLVLRALGHETAAPENAFLMAQNAGLLTADEAATLESKSDFTRGDMVSITYTANEIANRK